MPDQEYDVYHRFKPYFLLGQLDLSKEILIPKQKVIDGVPVDGFDVINPLYCYEGGNTNLARLMSSDDDPVSVQRAAVILNRGWIPAQYRDKRSRPEERNTRELVRFTGTFLKSKNIHDYKIPNDPNSNEWHNLCCEDIGLFWDLPNFDDGKYFYFQAMDLGFTEANTTNMRTPVQPKSANEVIEDYYGWWCNDNTHKWAFRGFGSLSALSIGLFWLGL